MTEPQPISYSTNWPEGSSGDVSNLRALSICHYVFGGLAIAFSSLFIGYIILGAMMTFGAIPVTVTSAGTVGPSPATSQASVGGARVVRYSSTSAAGVPSWLGYMLMVIGSALVLAGWTLGILTIVSGRSMMKRRRRMLSLIVAGIHCAIFPLGTVLGVFTFIVLLRQGVKAMYAPTY